VVLPASGWEMTAKVRRRLSSEIDIDAEITVGCARSGSIALERRPRDDALGNIGAQR